MSINIIAIKKDSGDHYDRYESINSFKYIGKDNNIYVCSLVSMVKFIEGGGLAFVGTAKCIVCKSINGNKYVKTLPDLNPNNNLLNLPEF